MINSLSELEFTSVKNASGSLEYKNFVIDSFRVESLKNSLLSTLKLMSLFSTAIGHNPCIKFKASCVL